MSLITQAVKGTQDVLPGESDKWQYIENVCIQTARLFGYREIRTPVFEHTELFERGVGDTTDVVQKEMYTFVDKGGRSITLRPEMTASAVRAASEHGLIFDALPVKACYIGGCYRSEKPQAGRLREFHQFGAELFGAPSPAADAEMIAFVRAVFDTLGIENINLELNSIGCPGCRAEYNASLKTYYADHVDTICETCKSRLDRNPMRLLDCKNNSCSKIAANAPRMLDHLCDDCAGHFEKVKANLDSMEIEYMINPSIVRGLDYYTKRVFEFTSTDLGAQSTVCGGGRYDGLFAALGVKDTSAIGFAMGLERLLMVMEAQGCPFPEPEKVLVYLAPMGDAALAKCLSLCKQLRDEGFAAETDLCGRSLKAQMKYADKMGAKFTCVIGDSELESGAVSLKNMATGEKTETDLDGGILDTVYNLSIQATLSNIEETFAGFEALMGGEE